jgi:hypothetical protein
MAAITGMCAADERSREDFNEIYVLGRYYLENPFHDIFIPFAYYRSAKVAREQCLSLNESNLYPNSYCFKVKAHFFDNLD